MKVEFMPGIDFISGSIKEKNGNRFVFKHRASDKPGHGRMYLYSANAYVRKKPVSEKEIAARVLFDKRVKCVKQLMDEQHITKSEAWQIAKDTIKS